MAALVIIFVGAVAAFAVSVLAGGGAGLVLIPLLGLALPAASVPAALSIGTAVSSASRLCVFRSAVRWDVARWFVPAAVPCAVLGAWLLTRLPPVYLEILLGLFLLGNVLFAVRRDRLASRGPQRSAAPAFRRPRPLLLALGALAGFISGFTGAVGVLFNDLYIRLGLTKDEIIATRASNEITLHIVKIVAYAWLGLMTADAVSVGSFVAVAALLATAAARRILSGLDDRLFRRLNHAAMGVAGIAMVMVASVEISHRHGVSASARIGREGLEIDLRLPGSRLSAEWSLGEAPEVEWRRWPSRRQVASRATSID